jgi:S1-C subfamily serine protease
MNARSFAASLLSGSLLALALPAAAEGGGGRFLEPLPPAALPPLPGKRLPVLPDLPAARPRAPADDPRPSAGAADLRKLSDALADVAERVSPAVVQIDVVTGGAGGSPARLSQREGGQGSGVIFSADGVVLTSNHVIEDARAITVRLRDGRMFKASVAGRDPSTDIALLRIEARGLRAAAFADSETARVGQTVLAIGSPFGLGHTVTSGVLSAKARGGMGINAVEDYLQTDASINPGNSGGPLVDLDGKVVGINTMIVSKGQGIGFAVPSSVARRVADRILSKGRMVRAYVGLGLQDLTPQIAAEIAGAPAAGALVNAVAPDGPAARARVLPGDVVLAAGAKPVRDAQDLLREVFFHDPGDALALTVTRGGKRLSLNVTLAARGEPPPPVLPVERAPSAEPGLGLSLRDVTGEDGRAAAEVVRVAPDSASDRAGVRAGDVVLEAGGAADPSAGDVARATQAGHVLLRLRRQGTVFYAAVRR